MVSYDSISNPCPTPDSLTEFVLGNISDSVTRKSISEHVETCDCCLENLATLGGQTDPLIVSLKRAAESSNHVNSDDESIYLKQARQNKSLNRDNGYGALEPDKLETSTEDEAEKTLSDAAKRVPVTPHAKLKTIGPYRLIQQIGAGGMGMVFKAVHTKMNRHVAIKLLQARRTGDVEASRRFEREMQAVGCLSHPNIVVGYDAGESDGHCFLAMELLDGVDLTTLCSLKDSPIGHADACELIRQTALALGYAHNHGIVHRDVKPSNIMLCRVDPSGTTKLSAIVKLLDLGLARFEEFDESEESMTSINQLMGTIDYMSPEQCLDSREVDPRSDVYSLGATLYRLLVGRPPWSGDEFESQGRKLKALLSQQVPSIETVRPDVSAELIAIVDRALCRDPFGRFQSIDEMAEALTPLAQEHNLPKLLCEAKALQADNDFTFGPSSDSDWNVRLQTPTIDEPFHRSAVAAPAQPPRIGKYGKWIALASIPIAILLFSILWLRTDGGYIRIESDPGIEVTVDILRDGKRVNSVEIGKSSNEYWYRSGEYEIRLPSGAQDSLTVKGERLGLSRGDRLVATITKVTDSQRALEMADSSDVEILSPDATVKGAPDLQATARWVLANEGTLGTENGEIRAEADIPQGTFEIHRIALRDADDEKTIKVCELIQQLRKCDRLYLNGGSNKLLTDDAMSAIGKTKQLKWLAIESARITDQGVLRLEEMPRLRTLGLLDLLITEKCLTAINQRLPNLTQLNIFSHSLSGNDLKSVGAMKQLRTFDLNTPVITRQLIQPLTETAVDRLTIRGVSKFEAGIGKQLAQMPELTDFAVQNSKFGDDHLLQLAESKKLKFLRLAGSTITPAGLKEFLKQQPNVVVYLEDAKSPLLELADSPNVKDVSDRH